MTDHRVIKGDCIAARLILSTPSARVFHGDHLALAAELQRLGEQVDLLCVDAPYSAKTHAGHDEGVGEELKADQGNDGRRRRRRLQYASWTPEDVENFVSTWAPLTRGWMVSLTDDVLLADWKRAMAAAGRVVFADVPAIITGMTVRLCGDGPSSWAIHCIVSRPKSLSKWGTLPGGYTGPSARGLKLVGGKPMWLMRALVRDYSRPGDLVCDPCCGAGTTLTAALREGRRAIGGDVNEEHARMAAGLSTTVETEQPSLFTGSE